jgi:uncharacterized GH25 family protein
MNRSAFTTQTGRAAPRARDHVLFAAALLLPGAAFAHDYWLQADQLVLAPGERLTVHLNLGQGLQVEEEKAYEVGRVERFELRVGRNDVRDLVPTTPEGAKPIFSDTIDQPQPFLMSLTRGVAQIEMSAQEFNEYTAHEGIPFSAQRERERERYWRFLKLLGRAGPETETDLHHRFTGAQFEIVLLQNPFTAQPGEEQIAQLLFETKPLAGAAVAALHRAADGTITRLDGVTDARGVVRFTLPVGGTWLIRSVHMRPCKGCKDVDWESFWAAYTFQL